MGEVDDAFTGSWACILLDIVLDMRDRSFNIFDSASNCDIFLHTEAAKLFLLFSAIPHPKTARKMAVEDLSLPLCFTLPLCFPFSPFLALGGVSLVSFEVVRVVGSRFGY